MLRDEGRERISEKRAVEQMPGERQISGSASRR
jgi:hypothetical protein